MNRARSAAPLVAALAGTAALYTRPELFRGRQLFGSDFLQLHQYRLEFVHEAWAAGFRGIPAWYSREALGTPFRADLQNFPLLPTRLLLLFFSPHAAYAPGVILAALLAVVLTYLLARSLGLARLASATAGFSFACSGFFASRVMAGHLPLLEAYPALPLLLWLAERWVRRGDRGERTRLTALALACACVALAGHPQLPFYALATTALYLLWRVPWREALRPLSAMALGCLVTLFAWWPMLRLIARSSRALPLLRPDNDVPFPAARVLALFSPWRDGWPAQVVRAPESPFTGFRSDAVFWETSSAVGLLPWLAAGALALVFVVRRRRVGRTALFFATVSAACILLAFPAAQTLFAPLPFTLFRSPARLWYVPTLALALACGAGIDALVRTGAMRAGLVRRGAALLLVGLHAWQLAANGLPFLRTTISEREPRPRIEDALARGTGTFRVALDYNLPIAPTRRYDDVGFFSSIQLASTYRALQALSAMPPGTNIQYLSGAREMPARALAACGVKYVGSLTYRPDLRSLLTEGGVYLFEVDGPTPRALFFPEGTERYWSDVEMGDRLRDPRHRLADTLLLPLEEAPASPPAAPGGADRTPLAIAWRRPSPDAMEVALDAQSAGWVRVLEAHDPGWAAAVDGAPARLVASDGFLSAVRVPPGRHTVSFSYAAPGGRAGIAFSIASAAALVLLLRRRHPAPVAPSA